MNIPLHDQQPEGLPAVSASIVLFHSCPTLLEATLRALAMATDSLPAPLTLFVIDHSTQADYKKRASEICRGALADANVSLRIISPARNEGYGAGHNQVLTHTLGDIHFILNPDIELEPSAVTRSIALMHDHPELTLVAPRGFLPNGSIDRLVKRYPSLLVFLLRGFAPAPIRKLFSRKLDYYEYHDLPADQLLAEVNLVSGCCMIVRTAHWRSVEGFDNKYFLYFEDYDLSMRMAQHGTVAQCSEIRVIHHGGGAARKGVRHIAYFASGLLRFFSTWGWKII